MHVHVIWLTYYMCFVINYTILVVLTGSCKVKYAQRLLLFVDVLRHDGNCTCTAEYPTTVYSYFMPVQSSPAPWDNSFDCSLNRLEITVLLSYIHVHNHKSIEDDNTIPLKN